MRSRHVVCSVVSPKDGAAVCELAASVARHMPDVHMCFLVVQDALDLTNIRSCVENACAAVGRRDVCEVIGLDDVAWGDFDPVVANVIYAEQEFLASLKPAFLRYLLAEGWDRVTYLDVDSEVFGDVADLLDDDADLTLTPHYVTSNLDAPVSTADIDVARFGLFNTGFVSVRPSAVDCLDWWAKETQLDAVIDPGTGRFFDQRVMDLVPTMANVQVLRHPGVNVAYWNLHERQLDVHDETIDVRCANQRVPLLIFHYAGFDSSSDWVLDERAVMKRITSSVPHEFAERRHARYASHVDTRSYTVTGVPTSEAYPLAWRDAVREDVRVFRLAGCWSTEMRRSLYETEGTATSHVDTGEVTPTHHALTRERFVRGWVRHPSLEGVPNGVAAFFRADGHESLAPPWTQLAWMDDELAPRLGAHGRFLVDVIAAATAAREGAVDLRIVGYLSYPAGVGQPPRTTLQLWDQAGIPCAIERIRLPQDAPEHLADLLRRKNPLARADAGQLVFVGFDRWAIDIESPSRLDPLRQVIVPVWAWELEKIPAEASRIVHDASVARAFALSNWSAQAISQATGIPVARLTAFDVHVTVPDATPPSEQREVPHPYVMATFDAKSFVSRKNPDGVLDVWEKVATDYPDVWLVLKSQDFFHLAPIELMKRVQQSVRTIMIDRTMTEADYFALLTSCDVYISLHRSEGLGLTPIEAALCGRPVVYTNYGGLVEFLDGDFYPVAYTMTTVGASSYPLGPYDPSATWAEPDGDDAERQLRRALDASLAPITTDFVEEQRRLTRRLEDARRDVVAAAHILRADVDARRVSGRSKERSTSRVRRTVGATSQRPSGTSRTALWCVLGVKWIYRHLPRATRTRFDEARRTLRGR